MKGLYLSSRFSSCLGRSDSSPKEKMNSQEMFLKNQQLSTEFTLYVWDHPEVADRIPDGALVVFLPEFDKELAKKNRATVAKLTERGQLVVYVKVKRMVASRLEGLSLEVA